MTKQVRLLIFALPLVSVAWGDTLTMRDGSQMSGRLVSAQNGAVIFAVEGAQRRFDVDRIARIDFNGPGDERGRVNGDYFGQDEHSRYDQYRNRPDYRTQQPQGGAIAAKAQDMGKGGVGIGQPISAEQTSQDGQGRSRVYQNATVYWSPRTGAHEVHGGIRDQYMKMGAENGRLGYPTSDETPAPDGMGRVNNFEHGSIYWSPRTGARVDFAR
jgi:uncharacterized protein with LGFP repeats